MAFKIEVFCTLQVEGTHNWTDCPYDDVDYLRSPHRHMFHIKAFKVVTHSDRDVEFIILKHAIEDYIAVHYVKSEARIYTFGAMSCEMLAEDLVNAFDLSRCEVSEDNENGAIVTKEN